MPVALVLTGKGEYSVHYHQPYTPQHDINPQGYPPCRELSFSKYNANSCNAATAGKQKHEYRESNKRKIIQHSNASKLCKSSEDANGQEPCGFDDGIHHTAISVTGRPLHNMESLHGHDGMTVSKDRGTKGVRQENSVRDIRNVFLQAP